PVGTGAYVIDKYAQGSQILMKKNPNSWRGTQGIDSVDMRIIPDASTLRAAFESGELDLMDGVQLNDVQRTSSLKNTKVIHTPSSQAVGLDMSYPDPVLSDKRVRLALSHAIDYQAIQKTVFFGVPKIMQGQMLTSDVFGFEPKLKPYSYDPDMARSLLKQAGIDKAT